MVKYIMTKTIKIKCSAAQQLPLDLILEFQGGLKKLSKQNLEKLKNNILLNGFIAPVFCWDDKGDYRLLDGHGRLKALISLRQEGYDIPLIPVDIIHAGSEAEAKQMLLSITSQYGEFDLDELTEWVNDIDDDISKLLRFTDKAITFEPSEPEEEPEPDPLESTGLKINITCTTQDQVKEIARYLLDKDVSFKIKL